MILMRENPFREPLEGVGPENRDFFGLWNGNEQCECHLGPKSVTIGAPSQDPNLGLPYNRPTHYADKDVNSKRAYIGNMRNKGILSSTN